MPGKWASRVTVCSHHCHKVEEVAGGGEVVEADSIKKVSDIKLLHVLARGGKEEQLRERHTAVILQENITARVSICNSHAVLPTHTNIK